MRKGRKKGKLEPRKTRKARNRKTDCGNRKRAKRRNFACARGAGFFLHRELFHCAFMAFCLHPGALSGPSISMGCRTHAPESRFRFRISYLARNFAARGRAAEGALHQIRYADQRVVKFGRMRCGSSAPAQQTPRRGISLQGVSRPSVERGLEKPRPERPIAQATGALSTGERQRATSERGL